MQLDTIMKCCKEMEGHVFCWAMFVCGGPWSGKYRQCLKIDVYIGVQSQAFDKFESQNIILSQCLGMFCRRVITILSWLDLVLSFGKHDGSYLLTNQPALHRWVLHLASWHQQGFHSSSIMKEWVDLLHWVLLGVLWEQHEKNTVSSALLLVWQISIWCLVQSRFC